MSALLEIRQLKIRYGASLAVQGIDMNVGQGTITSLIGSNGAGKTSVLRAISGLVAAEGSMLYDGHQLERLPAQMRARLGLAHVPEGRHVFPGMSVRENLILGTYCGRNDQTKQMIDEIETLFPRLFERRNQLAGSLSGGEQQMLAIGRALMSSPKLILMDEPTMGLAPQMIDIVIETMALLRQRGFSLLLVEQNAQTAIAMSDQVYALRLGQIVAQDHGSAFDVERLTAFYLDEDI